MELEKERYFWGHSQNFDRCNAEGIQSQNPWKLLRNPISQLLLLLLRSAKTEFYPHPRVVNWKSFARFLFARIWLWKLDSGQILFEKPRQKFCQAELCIPGKQWERRSGDQTQSFIWNIWAETLYLRSTLLCKYILQSQSFSSQSRSTMEKFSGWSIIHPILYVAYLHRLRYHLSTINQSKKADPTIISSITRWLSTVQTAFSHSPQTDLSLTDKNHTDDAAEKLFSIQIIVNYYFLW